MSIAVLITSCSSQLPWLEKSVRSVYGRSDFLILGYDTRGLLPHQSITDMCDVFFSGKGKGKQVGETFSLKVGLSIAAERAEYVLKMTGDAILEKPEGIRELPAILGNDDIISVQWNRIGGTLLFFGRTAPLLNSARDVLEVNAPQIERRFYYVMQEKKVKHRILPMEHEQGITGRNGVWSELLGYRHLHREIPNECNDRKGSSTATVV